MTWFDAVDGGLDEEGVSGIVHGVRDLEREGGRVGKRGRDGRSAGNADAAESENVDVVVEGFSDLGPEFCGEEFRPGYFFVHGG